MTARTGGEADKFGNRYEGRWTVWHLLEILQGRGSSIIVEPIGDAGDGAEFKYIRSDGTVEAHQVKRANRSANSWTVGALKSQGIWSKAQAHVAAGREYHFVSIVPAIVLTSLCDKARQAASADEFVKSWLTNNDLVTTFDELCKNDIYGSAEAAWTTLRGIWISWPDERHQLHTNAVVSSLLLSGAEGRLAAAGLGELVYENLGVILDGPTITSKLSEYGLSRLDSTDDQGLIGSVANLTDRWAATVRRELLDPPLVRTQTQDLLDLLQSETSTQATFLTGDAGGGKSAVLAAVVGELQAVDTPVLAFRLDRLGEFATTTDLGRRIGLNVSPVAALASVARDSDCVLVVDQLDAVSLTSGRLPDNFNAVADLVDEARAFPHMRVVLACRQFDINNDHRIRGLQSALKADTVPVLPLTDDEINLAVSAMGLDADALVSRQRDILRIPLHLVLLASVASQAGALDFRTIGHLFDAYWDRKRQAVRDRNSKTRFNDVVARVATAISDQQRLSVSDTVLDADDLAEDAKVLVSEHLLVRDGGQVAFFHEALFDYAFARQWEAVGESLVGFLTGSEQELFRRAQVRQIMYHLRQRDTDRYETEVRETLISDQVRFHVKEAMVAVLGGLADPSSAELLIAMEAANTDEALARRIWAAFRTGPWFLRADAGGQIDRWLNGTKNEVSQAIDFLSTGSRTVPDRVAEILAAYRDHADYPLWLRWVVRFASIQTSRPLFDLFVEGIRSGAFRGYEHDLWLYSHDIGTQSPLRAVELAKAYFAEGPEPFAVDDARRVITLTLREYPAAEILRDAAAAEPESFVTELLPYMLEVMRLTAYERRHVSYPADRHFSHFYADMAMNSEIDDALVVGMRHAIETWVKRDPEAARPMLERLAEAEYASAEWLLYCGFVAGAEVYADWAAEVLLSGPYRLVCEAGADYAWMPRLVIQAIARYLDDNTHLALEDAVRDLQYEWESRPRGGYAFPLLSALEESRLTDLGRRRLGEYRRALGVEQPEEDGRIIDISPRSPITPEAASHMSDNNWLQAIARRSTGERDWMTSRGGPQELSQVLKGETAADPLRFAKLALRLTAETNTAYTIAILWGLQEADVPPERLDTVFDCVRHIASLNQPDNDRWLGWALQRHLRSVPLDIVELIRDRAIDAPDPVGDRDIVTDDRERAPGERLRTNGMNSARGSLAETLGHMLVYDSDGAKTAAVAPALLTLAGDPVVSVRGQVAHLIGASLRFEREAAVATFPVLIDTDDSILTVPYVRRLMMYIGNGGDPATMLPVVDRMLASEQDPVRQCGGELAVFAALQWGLPEPLRKVMAGSDVPSRKGSAAACAAAVTNTRNLDLAMSTLSALFNDDSADVRNAAAEVASHLRNEPLRSYSVLLEALIASAAYEASLPQLFITLQDAPDRVDALALMTAQRFVEVSGAAAGDIRTGAAGNANYVSELAVRGLAQARKPQDRAALLDVIDGLLKVGAYGVDEAIEQAGR